MTLILEAGPMVAPADRDDPKAASILELLTSDLAAGRYEVPGLTAEEYSEVVSLDARYADLELGLADCAAIILAARYKTRRMVTFDERHFRAVMPLQGGSFEILPADAT